MIDESKFLVIYNTCEIKQNNLVWYIDCLKNLLEQDYKNFKVAISGCALHDVTKRTLLKYFGKNIIYNFIDDIYTVNITFNKTTQIIVNEFKDFDGIVYVDSGINVRKQTSCLKEIDKRNKFNKYGMIGFQTDNDTGFDGGLGFATNHIFKGSDYIIPIGKACNLHFQNFNIFIYNYYGKIIPDIFRAYCTESVFGFICAAMESKWIIVKDIVLEHQKSIDGATAGFDHMGSKKIAWNNLLYDLNMTDIINDIYAKEIGLGYEECGNIMMHDPKAYDAEGNALYPFELREYIKNKLFLNRSLLDYSTIKCQTIL